MPLFSRVLGQLEEHIKQSRRARLRYRTMVVIAQDRVDRLAVTSEQDAPEDVTRHCTDGIRHHMTPCHIGANVLPVGSHYAAR
ncbi:hypothetical protein FIU83_06260 [Halomonas sp. THAF5a]|uniref:hypothetical protein n=1 Tax=Halomonas sp. THAF5a TaxID=2587844 RepID=UPI00126935D7|nr:hypothetical protein [Halomonas sp. THAF5a]QFU01238.1 hypothetical protein FIU83_06260 [Halomonas sp. THAF5a]